MNPSRISKAKLCNCAARGDNPSCVQRNLNFRVRACCYYLESFSMAWLR